MAKKTLFLQMESIKFMCGNVENLVVVAIRKKMEIIMSIQVCFISKMNFDYTKNGGNKSFSCKSKDQYCVSQSGEHYCSTNNKKNGDYYEYLRFSPSWVNVSYKENSGKKSFIANPKHEYCVSQ